MRNDLAIMIDRETYGDEIFHSRAEFMFKNMIGFIRNTLESPEIEPILTLPISVPIYAALELYRASFLEKTGVSPNGEPECRVNNQRFYSSLIGFLIS